jgi:hypothetical protein
VLTLIVSIRNQGKMPVAEVHQREAEHNVTVPKGVWTKVFWEIPHVARDGVTSLTFRPWVNKRIASVSDAAAYEIGPITLERVDADAYEGRTVAPGRIAFSHTGYFTDAPKTALASGLTASEFLVMRANGGTEVLRKRIDRQQGRLGQFDVLDFSEVVEPGTYILRAGSVETRPFRIDARVWDGTIAKTIDFFYGERCGFRVPGVHDVCHRDWMASHGDQRIVMNGGWHDAGDLSQGLVNTGEATYAMFSLAAEAGASRMHPAWLPALEDEALWGLDWIHKVRFPGGFRVGFASMNIWTDGIIGNEDDRTAAALNNPNVNYIAAAVGAAAARHLKDRWPELAQRSLAIAAEDWRAAIVGVETPATLSTPAFSSTEMEQAAMAIVASVELYKATGREEYARKAWELSNVVVASQQVAYVGREFPLAGFFYTGPDHSRIFHQFHRGNDQAPLVAMSLLCETFPEHADWIKWYAGKSPSWTIYRLGGWKRAPRRVFQATTKPSGHPFRRMPRRRTVRVGGHSSLTTHKIPPETADLSTRVAGQIKLPNPRLWCAPALGSHDPSAGARSRTVRRSAPKPEVSKSHARSSIAGKNCPASAEWYRIPYLYEIWRLKSELVGPVYDYTRDSWHRQRDRDCGRTSGCRVQSDGSAPILSLQLHRPRPGAV